jgi:hypothetical protein
MGIAGIFFAFAGLGAVISVAPVLRGSLNDAAKVVDRAMIGLAVAGGLAVIGLLLSVLAKTVGRRLFLPGDWCVILATGINKPDGIRNPIRLAASRLSEIPIDTAPPLLALFIGSSHYLLRKSAQTPSVHLQKATEAFGRYLALAGPDTTVQFEMGTCLFEMGDTEKAIQVFDELTRSSPSTAAYAMKFAEALGKAGQVQRSILAWEMVATIPNLTTSEQETVKKALDRIKAPTECIDVPPTSELVASMPSDKLARYLVGSPMATLTVICDMPRPNQSVLEGALNILKPDQIISLLNAIPGGPSERRYQIIFKTLDGHFSDSCVGCYVLGIITGLCFVVALVGEIVRNWMLMGSSLFIAVLFALFTILHATTVTPEYLTKYKVVFGAEKAEKWRRWFWKFNMVFISSLVMGICILILLAFLRGLEKGRSDDRTVKTHQAKWGHTT